MRGERAQAPPRGPAGAVVAVDGQWQIAGIVLMEIAVKVALA